MTTTSCCAAACLAASAASGATSACSIGFAAATTRSTAAARSSALALEHDAEPFALLVVEAADRLSTSEEPEPGTSKPPLVRCLVCWLANGTEATTSSSHMINTSFLRVRTNAESRFMADCIRAYFSSLRRAEREHNRARVREVR